MPNPIKTIAGILPLAAILGNSCSAPQQPSTPNVIVILFDDLGWDDLGVHGNMLIETPHIDHFAEQSAQFSNFYVNPVCAASRASLLTGRHFLRTGVSHVHGGKDFLALDETTLADVLQQNGYKTAMWGKWHSGDAENYFPWQRGFDEALSLRLYKHENAEGYLNGEFISTTDWADEVIVDQAIDFMERNREQPFFAFLSLLSPHTPLVAPEEIIRKYEEKGLSGNFATLYAMIDFSDQELGRLFIAMDELGLDQNTVVMIFSDNGPAVNRAEITENDRAIRYVNGYRGHKGDIWENGVKSPLFVRWPGKIKPTTIDEVFSVTDIFSTVIDLAGIDFHPTKPLDGISFTDALLAAHKPEERFVYDYANKGWPPSLIPYNPDGNYNEYQPVDKNTMIAKEQVISVRTPRYKLMINPGIDGNFDIEGCQYVLIDMKTDPLETRNVFETMPDVFFPLRDSLINWYNQILEEPNAYAPPVLYLKPHEPTLIKATWVTDLSDNLLNTVTAVKKWQGQPGWVEYQVIAEKEDDYLITLEYKKPLSAHPNCIIRSGERMVQANLTGATKTSLGSISLEKGLNRIRVYVQNEYKGSSIDELLWLNFTPQ